MNSKKHIHVTCAIIERDGRVLAAQRSDAMSMPLKWEFPGGKIDPGERPEECLRREIVEELGIRIKTEMALAPLTHRYPAFSITLHPFICEVESGKIVLHEHADIAWLLPDKLHTLDWAEADLAVIEAYLAGVKMPVRRPSI